MPLRASDVIRFAHSDVASVGRSDMEVGFFIALPSRIVAHCRLRLLGSVRSLLCGVSRRKKDTQFFLLAHPRPPAEVVEAIKNPLREQKENQPDWVGFLFGCGGGI